MLTKQRVIIKIVCTLFTLIPFAIFNDFFLYFALGLFGFNLIINIFAYLKIKELKWVKYILNAFDGFLVFSSVAIAVFLIIIAIQDIPGDGGLVFLFYPALGGILFLGILGLYFTNSKTPQPEKKMVAQG